MLDNGCEMYAGLDTSGSLGPPKPGVPFGMPAGIPLDGINRPDRVFSRYTGPYVYIES
jgi:hypothetical protein